MYNKKTLIVIFSFIGVSFWLILIAITARSRELNNTEISDQKSVEKSEFVNIHFFRAIDNKPEFEFLIFQVSRKSSLGLRNVHNERG